MAWQICRFGIWSCSGNTKLKLHVQHCTPTYIFVQNKTQAQFKIIFKLVPERDVVTYMGLGPELY